MMPVVVLRPPLRALAGGRGEVEAEGATIHEILRNLERSYPRLAGWVLDEQGSIRATSGEVFGSVDGGGTWKSVARRLPPVTSVRPTS